MTVTPHRSIDHIQKRSSGRSKSASIATLKTPSWPTTIDPGHGVAVAGDLRTVVRAGLTSLAETTEHPGKCRSDTGRDLGEWLAAGRP